MFLGAQEVDLEADLRAAEAKNDTGRALKLSNQIQAIRDSYRRMSIWPLIEAGEFSAISQGQVTAEDLALSDGTFMDWVEAKANGLTEPPRTPARYALVTRDTALFQGLARAVQYGDFVAKAVLYDDLTSRKKLAKGEAIATVNEAFVNYNRLAGRGRQYLESVGLMWFYSYKLRIMKEAVYQLRHNPLRAVLTGAVPADTRGYGRVSRESFVLPVGTPAFAQSLSDCDLIDSGDFNFTAPSAGIFTRDKTYLLQGGEKITVTWSGTVSVDYLIGTTTVVDTAAGSGTKTFTAPQTAT